MRLVLVLLSTLCLCAQLAPARRQFARAIGEGRVSIKPDQAKVDVSVVTQAATAQEASAQNATAVTAVISALRVLLGANADIKTISYSLNPEYRFPSGGGTPTLTGYTATNTLEVTTDDLSVIGRIIDT